MSTASSVAERIDPRGPRFGAAVTSAVLAATVILGPAWGWPLLVLQTLAFGAGAVLGLGFQPFGWLFRRFVRPRLTAPAELEDARPPRFAQGVGLAFALLGLAGAVFSVETLFFVAVAFALVAALLNAVFDFCLGCEVYLLGVRLSGKVASARAGR